MSSCHNNCNHSWEGPLARNDNFRWDYGACTLQHFFLLPGIELKRWIYPQLWTQGAFHKPQGWWNMYWPFTYLHAISKVLFNLAATRCLDSHSLTASSSLAAARCADLHSATPGISLAATHCADLHSTAPPVPLLPPLVALTCILPPPVFCV